METVTIAKEEYESLQEVAAKITQIELVIHSSTVEGDLRKLSERTAEELWSNEYDEIWNTV